MQNTQVHVQEELQGILVQEVHLQMKELIQYEIPLVANYDKKLSPIFKKAGNESNKVSVKTINKII
jgi:hypothetical protein